MTTLSTASTYINNINEFYPVAGQDNSTQGLRDNFKNIKLALDLSDQEIYNISVNSVKLTNPINDFNNNIIKKAQLQNSSVAVYDDSLTVQTGDVVIDFSKGSYQIFTVSSGTHWFSVSNWPGTGIAGSITLAIKPQNTSTTLINFDATNVYNLGPNNLPIDIKNEQVAIFNVWSDGDPDNLYVEQVNRSNTFTKPITLPSYTTSTLASLTNVLPGTMAFLTSGYNKPVYYDGSNWYLINGTLF